jgi:glycosyltransferase involved in cell wall biosynthesis
VERLRILTWHVHGNYLYYLSQAPHDFFVLSKPERPPGYSGRHGHLPWGSNVIDMPVADVRRHRFDCVLFQSREHFETDQHTLLSEAQRRLPRIYLEHDPPQAHPTNTRHIVDDPAALLVHVTHFNRLMWDSGRTPSRVVEHGVIVPPGIRYGGELARGIVVVNHLHRRGRRLGADVFERARREVPLDLVGMAAEESGGLGEIRHAGLAEFQTRYRFFFNPIRYTSLGLAVCEAMMLGMPVVALATTEMAVVIENGVNGYASTDVEDLIARMQELLADPALAHRLGEGARRTALERFHIQRFTADWNRVFAEVTR